MIITCIALYKLLWSSSTATVATDNVSKHSDYYGNDGGHQVMMDSQSEGALDDDTDDASLRFDDAAKERMRDNAFPMKHPLKGGRFASEFPRMDRERLRRDRKGRAFDPLEGGPFGDVLGRRHRDRERTKDGHFNAMGEGPIFNGRGAPGAQHKMSPEEVRAAKEELSCVALFG